MDPGSGGGGVGGGGSSSGSSSSDSAPDCWDQADMEAPAPGPCGGPGGPLTATEAQREHLSAAFSRQLNVNAKPFVPNVHAAEFVPSFLRGPAQPPPPSGGASTNNHGAGSGAGGPSGKGSGLREAPKRGRKPGCEGGSSGLGACARLGWGGVRRRASHCLGTWGPAARGALTAASGAGSSGWGGPGPGSRPPWGGRGGGPGGAVEARRRHWRGLGPVPAGGPQLPT